jgi:preprotein translocase subunit SecG
MFILSSFLIYFFTKITILMQHGAGISRLIIAMRRTASGNFFSSTTRGPALALERLAVAVAYHIILIS